MMINKTGYTFSFPLPFMLGHNMRGNRRGVLYVSRKDASLPFSKLNVDFLLYCAECQFINQLKIIKVQKMSPFLMILYQDLHLGSSLRHQAVCRSILAGRRFWHRSGCHQLQGLR